MGTAECEHARRRARVRVGAHHLAALPRSTPIYTSMELGTARHVRDKKRHAPMPTKNAVHPTLRQWVLGMHAKS